MKVERLYCHRLPCVAMRFGEDFRVVVLPSKILRGVQGPIYSGSPATVQMYLDSNLKVTIFTNKGVAEELRDGV